MATAIGKMAAMRFSSGESDCVANLGVQKQAALGMLEPIRLQTHNVIAMMVIMAVVVVSVTVCSHTDGGEMDGDGLMALGT